MEQSCSSWRTIVCQGVCSDHQQPTSIKRHRFDAHSEVTAAVLNHVHAVTNHRYIEQVIASIPGRCHATSDGGASQKI